MKIRHRHFLTYGVLLSGLALTLSGCSGIETEAKYPTGLDRTQTGDNVYGERESILGDDGFKIFGGKDKEEGSTIGVNSFLWRATLDTLSFMPISSADPFGGVILTDWYTDPSASNERVKVNAFILNRELKADGIRVRTFRQVLRGGSWIDADVSEDTARQLEDTILTRARQLRIAHLENQ
ncbi:MAG: DUF3576 domain-containing protein [Alphaproteobacteria bacterium]